VYNLANRFERRGKKEIRLCDKDKDDYCGAVLCSKVQNMQRITSTFFVCYFRESHSNSIILYYIFSNYFFSDLFGFKSNNNI